jgi:hypothetical protein
MMGDARHSDAHCLLHQPGILEAVRIDEGADQSAFNVRLRWAVSEGGRRGGGRVGLAIAFWARVGLTGASGLTRTAIALLHGTFLLAGREGLVELAVDEEIAEDTAGTPGDAVGPSFDAGRVLFVDENTAAAHKMTALSIVRSSRHMV